MQHYMPIILWTVIVAKTAIHDDKAASMRRYIYRRGLYNVAQCYIILSHNVAYFCIRRRKKTDWVRPRSMAVVICTSKV